MAELLRPALIIPVLDEREAFPLLFTQLPQRWRSQLLVVDNGSEDGTWQWLVQNKISCRQIKQRGYGAACYTGHLLARELGFHSHIFMDGDGSDLVTSLDIVEDLILKNPDSFVFTVRRPHCGPWHARWGTWLLLTVIKLFWSQTFLDLAPLRAMSVKNLEQLEMTDRSFGWTLEMQVRVLQQQYSFLEVELPAQNRLAGKSKVSGSIKGSWLAAQCLLFQLIRLKLSK